MKFFLYTASISKERDKDHAVSQELLSIGADRNTYSFVFDLSHDDMMIASCSKDTDARPETIEILLNELGVIVKEITCVEITSRDFARYLNGAVKNKYIRDPRRILVPLKLNRIFSVDGGILPMNTGYTEACAPENKSREEINETLHNISWQSAMADELDRIETTPKREGFFGHPVHYLFSGDNFLNRSAAVKELIADLYRNKRVRSCRYCEIDIFAFDSKDTRNIERLYECYTGGTVVIQYGHPSYFEDELSAGSPEDVKSICEMAQKHRKDVLTVLCFPSTYTDEKELFFHYLPDMVFVELAEDVVNYSAVRGYMETKLKAAHLDANGELFAQLSEERDYSVRELDAVFNQWEDHIIKTEIFPQYSNMVCAKQQDGNAKPKNNAYERLQSMIGLTEVKVVIDSIIDYTKIQNTYKKRKCFSAKPSLHMCFTGNPGSAKTTVARLFAEILRDNGCLSGGQLVECGRSDLVGRYVGWTAQQVKAKFKEARGGVLFIDEAYSLVDDRTGLYGDEAINTIVQEMENNRDDLIVIFAGYPDKMNEFLDKNPGLRSRIAFHVPFADYNAEELYRILELMCAEKELKLSDGVHEQLMPMLQIACESPDYGNGRYVRNVLEKAILRQATRIIHSDETNPDEDTLYTLLPEDFSIDTDAIKERCTRKIGFCA